MAKRPSMAAPMDDLLGGKRTRPKKTGRPVTGDMIVKNVRLPRDVWDALQEHFRARGLKAGTGIRHVIMEYLQDQGVL